MSRTIDTRVVELEFDNKRFEDNVKVSSSTLNKFKDSLDLDGVANNLSISSAIITGALLKIGAQVVETGTQIAKAITLDPIIQGLASYEQQIQAVQVIMNATGDTMSHVEGVMSRLSWFADETSYSMDQMTNAASRFVSNNIPLEQSATAIQGIATMSALAGVNGAKAAIAFNNMADAVAKGGLSAIDYKSLELAGITTTEFKKTAIEAAIAMGTLSESGKILNGRMKGVTVTIDNFKETLSDQASGMWFSNEVIMAQAEAFGKYATEVHRVQEELGVTANRAMQIITETMGADWESLGKKAFLAAQESKTLTDSINYTKDALASGWASTWKIVLGNYEEAKVVFTALSDLLYKVVVASGDTRNEILSMWKDDGGRQALLESLDYLVHVIKRLTAPIKEAFGDIFPSTIEGTAKKLVQLTEKVRDTLKNFSMTKETAENLRKTFSGLFSMADIGITFFKSLATFAGNVVKLFFPATTSILKLTGGFGEFITKIRDTIKDGQMFEKFFDTLLSGLIKMKDILSPVTTALSDGLSLLGDRLGQAGAKIKDIFSGDGGTGGFGDRVKLGLSIVTGYVQEFLSTFDGLLSKVTERIQKFAGVEIGAGFFDTLKGVLNNLPTMESIVEQVKQFFYSIITTISTFSPALKKAWEVAGPILDEFFKSIKNTLGNLNLEKTLQILNSILSIGLVKTLMNLTGAFGEFSKSSTKVMTAFADVLIQVKDSIKAFTWSVKSKAILDIAIAIGILVAALVAMSFVDIAKLGISLGFLTVVIGELLAAFYVLGKVKSELKAGDLMKMSVVFVGLGAAILILSNAMVKIAQLDWAQIGKGLTVITLLLAELTIIAKVLGGGKSIASIGASFIALSIALFALIKVLMLYVNTDIDTLSEGLTKTALTIMSLGIALKAFSSMTNLPATAAGLLILNLALTGLAGLILLYSKFSFETLFKGLVTIAAGIVTLGLAVKTFKASLAEAGAFAIMALALGSLVVPLLLLSKLSFGDIVKGIIGVAGAAAVLVLGAKALDKQTSANLAALGAALLAFAGGFKVLSVAMKGMDNETFAKTLIAVGGATLLLIALSKAGAHSKGAVASATAMLVVMSGIAAVFHLLATFSDVDAITEVAKALSLMMTAMSVMLLSMSNIDSKKVMQAEGTVLALTLILAPIGLVLMGMAKWVENPENLIPIAVSLGILIDALSVAIVVLSSGKYDIKNLAAAIGALGLLSVIAAGLGLLLVKLSQMENIGPIIQIAISIGILAGALSASVAILGLLGPLVSAAGAAIIPLMGVIGVTLSLVMVLGALADKRAQAEDGIEMLALIGLGIGKFIGSIVGGVASGITSVLPQVGKDLTNFIINAQGFIYGVKQLDASFLSSIGILASALLAITAADLLSSIMNFFKGGFDSKALAEKLSDLGTALTSFANSTSTIADTDGIKNSAEAVKFLFEALSNAPRSGGLFETLFTGSQNLSGLKEQLTGLGNGLKAFYETTIDLKTDRLNGMSRSMTNLFKALSEAPNSGGLLEEIVGGNNVGDHGVGAQLASFGGYLVEFYDSIKNLVPGTLTSIAEAMSSLFKALKESPNSGGVVSWFTGNNDVGGEGGIGEQLVSFGEALAGFAESTKGVTSEAIGPAIEAMVSLFAALKEAPNSGGAIGLLTGNNDVGKIGDNLATFGEGLYDFSQSVATVSPDRLGKFGEAIAQLFSSFKEINAIASAGFHSIATFSAQLVTIGKRCVEFAGMMTPEVLSVIEKAEGAIDTISKMLTVLSTLDVKGDASLFVTSLTTAIGESLISDASKQILIIKMEELLAAMFSAFWSPKTEANLITAVDMMFLSKRFDPAGQQILEGLSAGMKDASSIIKRCDEIANVVSDKFEELFPNKTIPAGKDFINGFITGIESLKPKLLNAITSVGLSSVESLRTAIDAHSDSRKTVLAGEDFGSGYETGIENSKEGIFKTAWNIGSQSVTKLIDGVKTQFDLDGFEIDMSFSQQIESASEEAEKEADEGGTKVGKKLVNNAASGIKKEKTAEEAAKEKAQAIVDAFSEGLSGLSRVMERLSLELNIFEKSLGFLSSDDTYSYASREAIVNQKKLETLTQQLAHQQEKVAVTQEKYNKMLAEFGADSTYTKDAYDELRKAQYEALDMQWQIDELRYNTNKKKEDILKQGADKEAEFKQRLAETIREYQEQGRQFSLVDLQAKIAKDVGYDPEWRQKLEGVMTQAAVETGKVVSDTYQENVMTGLTGFTGDYTKTGLDYSKALGDGFVSGVPAITSGTMQAMQESLVIARQTVEDWYNVGADSIKSFAQGIIDNLEAAISAGAEIAKAAIDAAIRVLMFGGGKEGGPPVPMGGGGGSDAIIGQMSEEQKSYAEAVANGTSDAWIAAWAEGLKAVENSEISLTVSPVLDLDELTKDIKSGVANTDIILPGTSSSIAQKAASASQQKTANQNGSDTNVNNYSFVQNNTSPKALSRIDIYRNTANQFSLAKEVVKA